MEIITLDHQVYQDLVTRINRISDYVFKKAAVPTAEPEIWLTSEELAELLKISTRTLQRMRKERTIPYCMIRSKCLYRFSDVEKCIAYAKQVNPTIEVIQLSSQSGEGLQHWLDWLKAQER